MKAFPALVRVFPAGKIALVLSVVTGVAMTGVAYVKLAGLI